ncbi:MAG: ribose 5-phosphate isomerase A [Candidatus Dormiibacterota bacterium]
MGLSPEEFAAAAAEVGAYCAGLVAPGMRLGLGSGRMATAFIAALQPRIEAGLRVQGLCTSEATESVAMAAGVEILASADGLLDVDIDGADEYDLALNLSKGGGGALLREKVVAQRSRRFWVVADSTKQVNQLATRHPLAAEILPFDWEGTAALCQARLSCRPVLREMDGYPFRTDNGNYVIDLHFPSGLADPEAVAGGLEGIAGVLGHGLFLGLATAAVIFDGRTVQVLGDLNAEGAYSAGAESQGP